MSGEGLGVEGEQPADRAKHHPAGPDRRRRPTILRQWYPAKHFEGVVGGQRRDLAVYAGRSLPHESTTCVATFP